MIVQGNRQSRRQPRPARIPVANEAEHKIGHKLRGRRRQMKKTLEQVAGMAGLTKGFLSDIERDLAAPSMASVVRLCGALDMPVSSLFERSSSDIVRVAERRRVFDAGVGMNDYQVTPGNEGRLLVVISEMEPGASTGEAEYSLNCEQEFVFVVSGRICISIEQQDHVLEAGDTLTYDPLRLHGIRNGSADEPATVLYVMTPPPR